LVKPTKRGDDLEKNKPTWAQIQKKLNALGCDAGPVDGKAGRKTADTILRFTEKAGISNALKDEKFSKEFIKRLNNSSKNFCIQGYLNLTFAKGCYPCCSEEDCSKEDARAMKVTSYDLNQRRMSYIRQDGFSSFCTLMKNKTVTCGSSSSDTSATYKAAQDGLVSGFYWLDNNGNMLCE